ncbi:MAG: hypothetical protein GY750_01435 [Lentisphaerae bacterium]|nr:hypothetical protein [Lentisphaerota bacterium]MCP4100082.1 hypothetical protein [Lentisphaerota bacterium]
MGVKYYVSYALIATGNRRPGRLSVRSPGHAQIFLTECKAEEDDWCFMKAKQYDWFVNHAYGLYGRGETHKSLISGFFTGNFVEGHLRNELNQYTDYKEEALFYFRNYRVNKHTLSNAKKIFDEDRKINVRKLGVKTYRGPNFSVKYFNCHKYATRFLVRLGIIDGHLLKYDYPSQADINTENFQHVMMRFGGFHLLTTLDKNSNAPKDHTPENIKFPSSYYKIANRFVGRKFKSTYELKQHIRKRKLQRRLYTIGIELMKDYRKTNFNRIIHFKRHNTKLADKLIFNLKEPPVKSLTEDFTFTLDKFIRELPFSVNVTGSFFRRLIFLRELV